MSLDMTTELVCQASEYFGGVFVTILCCALRSLVKDTDDMDDAAHIIHFHLQFHSRSSPCVSVMVPPQRVSQDRSRAKRRTVLAELFL